MEGKGVSEKGQGNRKKHRQNVGCPALQFGRPDKGQKENFCVSCPEKMEGTRGNHSRGESIHRRANRSNSVEDLTVALRKATTRRKTGRGRVKQVTKNYWSRLYWGAETGRDCLENTEKRP